MGDFVRLVSGLLEEASAINTTAGAGDAGKVIKTDAGGLLAASFLPFTVDTSTDLDAGAASDSKVPTQLAVKTYVDQIIAAQDAMVFKGVIDASGNPNYPAADRGHTYRISVAGKIGGASGPNVEVGDIIICITDSTSAGTHAGVGANWGIIQMNLDGAVIGPASATDGHFAQFDGASGKLLKGGKAAPSGVVVGTSDSQTLTNKTLAAATNTLTDFTLSIFASGVIDAADDLGGGSSSDSVVATQLAVKTYVDNEIAAIPAGGTPTDTIIASGALADGDFVEIFDNAGTPNVRKADANTTPPRKAHGFVLAAYSNTDPATVYLSGINDSLSGMTVGAMQFLSNTAGGRTETCPTGAGILAQQLGHAFSATEMYFNPGGVSVIQV